MVSFKYCIADVEILAAIGVVLWNCGLNNLLISVYSSFSKFKVSSQPLSCYHDSENVMLFYERQMCCSIHVFVFVFF